MGYNVRFIGFLAIVALPEECKEGIVVLLEACFVVLLEALKPQ